MTNGRNYKLYIGVFLFFIFVFIAISGSFFAPYQKDFSVEISYEGDTLIVPPLPPSKDFLFGTDKWGYDLFSQMLYGAKYTVFTVLFVAAFRVIIGSVLGVLHSLRNKKKKKRGFTIFTSIPSVVFIYFIMYSINFNPLLSTLVLVCIQAGLMIIFGVAGVYDVVYAKTEEIKEQLYIMASKTLGGTYWHICKKHIMPILKTDFLLLFVNEAMQVLYLIGQLSIFSLFVGGTEVQVNPTIYLPITFEWSGLIAQSRSFFQHSQWIVLFPLAGYVLFLLSFYWITEGWKQKLDRQIRKKQYIR